MPTGVYIRTKEVRKKMSLSHTGKSSGMKGKKQKEESKRKTSISMKGKNIWSKGRISPNKGKKASEDLRRKMSLSHLGYKPSREHIRKALARRKMSGLEEKFLHFIQKHNLPYKFVGNGDVFIGRKNPDFINTNGQKIAVEVYWKRHKEQLRNISIEQWMQERIEIFAEYGWIIKFFEGNEVNEKNILLQLT